MAFTPENSAARFELVVVGASAGGIDAVTAVLSGLPADLPVPVLVVQHISPDKAETRLPEVLGRHTPLAVSLARQGLGIRPGHVYVAQPDRHLRIEDRCLQLDRSEPVRFVRPSVDVLFRSAARNCGPGVIGVILTGIGSDGARGCRDINAHGGLTIAQDPLSAGFPDMPDAAIKTGTVDFILPLDTIAHKLRELIVPGGAGP